jgi:hypothetical protein
MDSKVETATGRDCAETPGANHDVEAKMLNASVARQTIRVPPATLLTKTLFPASIFDYPGEKEVPQDPKTFVTKVGRSY